jgi:orotidine-5'-phosphate decarboxylase
MKVEIVEVETISELDRLINSVIEDRKVSDIKLTTTVLSENKIKYTAMIMLGD